MCRLDSDPTLTFDALVKADPARKIRVFLQGVAEDGRPAPPVGVVSATLRGSPLPVSSDGKMEVTFPAVGIDDLSVAMVGPQPQDKVQFLEACDDGSTRVLRTRRVQPGPGGSNPVMSFHIHVT